LIAVSSAVLGFASGMMMVIDSAYDSAKDDMLQELRLDMRIAIAEGRPFYLVNSNIKMIPRQDGNMNVQIAGAGDEGMRKVWK